MLRRADREQEFRSQLHLALGVLSRDRLAMAGFIVIAIAVLLSILAPWISPYDPATPNRAAGRLVAIGSPGHALGTDGLARDILSRLLWGGRVSLTIAVLPVVASAVCGLALGLVAGMSRRWVSGLIMRTLDVFFAFPPILLALAVATVLGPGMLNVMMSIVVVFTPYMARVVYVETLAVRSSEYVEAARVAGTGPWRLVMGEILPNVLPPLVVYATTGIGGMIVMASGLSFLGVGVQPPTADWGIMMADGRIVLRQTPHVASIPGAVILVVALAFNVAGDGIRDALDPRRRSGRK